jgi:hypothetical protein
MKNFDAELFLSLPAPAGLLAAFRIKVNKDGDNLN